MGLGLPRKNEPPRSRRSFLPEHAGDLWVGDAMHGPHTRGEDGRAGKAYLLSILDAATRYVVSVPRNATDSWGAPICDAER